MKLDQVHDIVYFHLYYATFNFTIYTKDSKIGGGRKNYTFGPLINAVFAATHILPSCGAATRTFYVTVLVLSVTAFIGGLLIHSHTSFQLQ